MHPEVCLLNLGFAQLAMRSYTFDNADTGTVKVLAGGLIRLRGPSDNLPQ